MIDNIEQALKWMENNGRKLGAAYVLGKSEADAVMRIFGNYVVAAKDYPDLVSITAENLVGAINALTTMQLLDDTRKTLMQSMIDTQVKEGE